VLPHRHVAGDVMGDDVIGGIISDAILLTARRALCVVERCPARAVPPRLRRLRSVWLEVEANLNDNAERGHKHRTPTNTCKKNPEHEELEVRMILKARFSMRWPDRCEI